MKTKGLMTKKHKWNPDNIDWKPGQKAELAERCGISASYLSDLLAGRTGETKRARIAATIEDEARDMGIPISRDDILYPHEPGFLD